MSLSRFTFTDRARPIVEIGVGDSRIPTGTSRWDRAHWDRAGDTWAGNDPTWLDETCNIISADINVGRVRVTDRFEVGTCMLIVDNASGWADPAPVPDAVLALRPGRQIRVGIDHEALGRVWRFWGVIDRLVPDYDPVEPDQAQIMCIDMLGDANRAKLLPATPAPVEVAGARVARVLARVPVLASRMRIDPTSVTVRADPMEGQVADLVHQAADSAAGSVFGDVDGTIRYRARDWQTYSPDTPPDGTIGNVDPYIPGYWTPAVPAIPAYLNLAAGTASTPDTPDMTLSGPVRLTVSVELDTIADGQFPSLIGKFSTAREILIYAYAGSGGFVNMSTTQSDGINAVDWILRNPLDIGVRHTYGTEFTPGSTAAIVIYDDTRTPIMLGAIPAPPNTTDPVTIGSAGGETGRIYWAQLEHVDGAGTPTGVIWRFDAAEYPGTGLAYTDPRGRTWTLSAPGAITPTVPAVPAVWVPGSGDVCPTSWTRPFDRADIATRVIVGRSDPAGTDTPTPRMQFDDQPAQVRYGVEPFERQDLLTVTDADLTSIGERWLRTRGEATAPRIATVNLDAATTDEALDLMTTASPYTPSRYRCRLLLERGEVFDRQHFVTRYRHQITADQWLCELSMDIADTFAAVGGRWDKARWGRAVWSGPPSAFVPLPIGA